MHIKSIIIGLVLFIVGSGALWWTVSERRNEQKQADIYRLKYGSETSEYIQKYEQWLVLSPEERTELPLGLGFDENGNPKTQARIQQEQQERLKADMDKLAAGEMTVYPFADDFYGENWQAEIEKYKKRKEINEFVFTGSVVCASVGGFIVGWYVLIGIARVIIRILTGCKNILCRIFGREEKPEEKELSETITPRQEAESVQEQEVQPIQKQEPEQDKEPPAKEEKAGNIAKVLINSGWQYSDSLAGKSQKVYQRKRVPLKSKARVENAEGKVSKESSQGKESKKDQNNDQSVADKKKNDSKEKTESETILTDGSKQSNPIDSTLKDLTQQVSAIREYAAHQQNRLEKLQDGYDWNIIKTFCLRIIRCIDNIDSRIAQLVERDDDVSHLEEVKDELIFALESSGVEQFEPELNSEYRGQEKFAEAVKEKKRSKDPEQKGRIEKVIRPGYQCFIDEENVRIVRPAQVRLYA
ncbi:MAG: hypothetical protein JW715_10435 [Sedimentisphaerales bacterium]|nr:hypothetical protein [Sedimentisphaerales bacterium]